ncbi:IQ and AAA domain-containing protein 1 isoform X2 [Numida meleagris]|uniref:IQ and AAA domain-containing protein 1 isoform X2 n=1 Tax=Numida meleagris TaxID=8996 RepID=UPI000B3DF30F|nr:IQ and AAA domain-containing protein 1 isoform X2 [Numida meleagris]
MRREGKQEKAEREKRRKEREESTTAPSPGPPHASARPRPAPSLWQRRGRGGAAQPRALGAAGMSQATYNTIWTKAQKDLDTQLQTEREQSLQLEKDRVKAFRMLAASYIRYLQIFHRLEDAHDHLIHQQKRAAIQQVLDGVIGRVLEVKKEMVEMENSEFHFIDNIIEDLKLLPEDTEVPIPKYFVKENLEVLQQREKTLDEILLNAGLETQKPVKAMTLEEAIKMIQVAERARQGRRRALFMKQIYSQEKRKRQTKLQEQTGPNPDDAASCIQKVWRGYIQRKKTEKMREEEMIFLGMSLPPHFRALHSPSEMHARQEDALRGEVQERQEEEFIKDKLRETEGLDIRETLQDQIGQCFIECRHIIGRFPDYPAKEAGGSMAIFSQKTPEQVAAELAAEREMALQKKSQKEKKEKGEKGKEKEKGRKTQKTGKKEEDEGWKMAPSNFLPILEEGNSQYRVWQNRDEGRDFLQDHDPELIKAEKREEVEEEIRVQVDELMQQKLENLKLAVDGEKSSKKKKGRKSEKKKKTGKKKIPELEEDLTPDRTIDSLYRELVEKGVLIKAKPVNLSNYVGEYSYLGTTLRQVDVEPMPSLADIRQLVTLYGILPLGSQTVHEKAPLVKALLLAGPTGVGKKMLVHAICTETGANLFNLSPSNIAGKYPGKNGLQMMLHMVLKVAKQLQPSVVWIGDTEKTFYKTVPKAEEQMNPKRLEKILPKFLKALKAEDRVLLVGTSNRPFDAKIKPFCKVYQKIILIPRPDYASRFVLWKHTITQHGGEITKLLSISCLAKLSDGFTQGRIVQTVQAVLSELRLLQMSRKPLHTAEFLTLLASQDPVYNEEEEMFKAWYAKTPLGRARSKALAMSEKAGKGKGKKK